MMTNLIAPWVCTAIATVFMCSALPTVAAAADRGLGADAVAACAALSGAGTGATKIDAAALTEPKPLTVAAGGPTPTARINPATPQFCRVLGHIDPTDPKAPPIRFQLNLPLQWNGRSVQYGGGGFNGVLITGVGLPPAAPFDSASPLAKGFATYGTDSGHETRPGEPPQLFAANDEAFVNFAHASYKKVRDAAVMLIERAYGAKPEKMYYLGSSEGGREGLTMAQRYPNDFDGIFARVPVINWVGLQHAGTRAGLATMGDSWIRPAQVNLVHDAVLAACDAQDGIADALVEDAVGCKARFDPAKLLCVNGAGGDQCLGEAQVAAIRALQSPYRFSFALANGVTVPEVGDPLDPAELVALELPRARFADGTLIAHVRYVDGFGNVQLNAGHEDLADTGLKLGRVALVELDGDRALAAQYARTFADVARGDLLLYEDAARRLSVAVSHGDAADRLGVDIDDELRIRPE